MLTLPPEATKGKSVKAAWQALVAWAKSTRILPGPGVRLARTAAGTIISFSAPRQTFRGAFACTLTGDRVTIGLGTVEGIEPTLNGQPITGDKKHPPPTLLIANSKFNAAGKSWVCVRAKVTAGKFDPKAKDAVEIIQSDRPHGRDNTGPFAPLAMLRRPDKDTAPTLHQIAYWHLRLYTRGTRSHLAP